MKFNDPFIGADGPNTVEKFSGGDSKKLFLDNLKTSEVDWFYRDVEITYAYNEYGHRCKNIFDIDLDNYILFTGCSHTEGIGLELEKTYPYQIASELGYDYYNLAIAGTGIDVMMYNLNMWFLVVPKKPKFLVVQWPDETRYVRMCGDRPDSYGIFSEGEDCKKFVYYADKIDFFSSRRFLAEKTVQSMVEKSALINVGAYNDFGNINLHLSRIYRARDLSHSGILSNQILAQNIINKLK